MVKIQSSFDADLSMIKLSQVSINTDDGVTLSGISFIHPQATVSIVLFGGSGMKISSSSKILERFALIPANVTWFDYRGVGSSTKKDGLSIDDLKKDALNVFDFASKLNKRNLPIIVHGISMGSIIVGEFINKRDVDGVVLDGAISSVTELIDQTTPSWTTFFTTVTVVPELASLNNIDKIIFNSNWSKKRFFIDLKNKELLSQKTSVCFQSSSKRKIG
jgi:predicted alpha/beta hydrolase